jgi:hypothetical protein
LLRDDRTKLFDGTAGAPEFVAGDFLRCQIELVHLAIDLPQTIARDIGLGILTNRFQIFIRCFLVLFLRRIQAA